jgi:hypothetical protein
MGGSSLTTSSGFRQFQRCRPAIKGGGSLAGLREIRTWQVRVTAEPTRLRERPTEPVSVQVSDCPAALKLVEMGFEHRTGLRQDDGRCGRPATSALWRSGKGPFAQNVPEM